MSKLNIGEIKKLVVVGDGVVAAIGTKGTFRFYWEVAHSRARVDEMNDVRLNALLRYGFRFGGGEDLAAAMPKGAVIPLPSEKRATNWMKRTTGPKQNSRWFFDSAIEAGFKPRYYLGESKNPYQDCTRESWYWQCECVYLPAWARHTVEYARLAEGFCKEDRAFVKKIPDWQTRVLVAWMVEDEFNNGVWENFEEYLKAVPLL